MKDVLNEFRQSLYELDAAIAAMKTNEWLESDVDVKWYSLDEEEELEETI